MNYYQVLGVSQDADPLEIKRAYYSAVKKHTPDKDPDGFKTVRTAYETLSKSAARAEYDQYFTKGVSDVEQQELLAVRDLFARNQFKQIIDILTEGKKPKSDSVEINLVLAETYLRIGKSGMAETIVKKILTDNPRNTDAIRIRALACIQKGHTKKAREYFLHAIDIDPGSPSIWLEYVNYLRAFKSWLVAEEINRAFDYNKSVFKDNYALYLFGCAYALENDLPDRACEHMSRYVDGVINDKDMDRKIYVDILKALHKLSHEHMLRDIISKAVPVLIKSRHRRDEDAELISKLENGLVLSTLSADDRIHEVVVDLTELLMDFDGCEECQNNRHSMELYIIQELQAIRPCIRVLQREYPELFKLNSKFYMDVLDAKKEESLQNSAVKKYRKLAKSGFLDDTDIVKTALEQPFVREAAKVGRNEPCPCGSGKKYKKCCGL